MQVRNGDGGGGGGEGWHILVSNMVRVSDLRRTLPPEISRSTTPPGPAQPHQRGSSSRAHADCKTFYWVLTFLLTDGFTF